PLTPEQSPHLIDNHGNGLRSGLLVRGSKKMQWPSTTSEAGADAAAPTRLSLEEQQALVMQYAPLVRRVARSLPLEIPGLLEFEDAVGYGTCGLVEAVRRYDPSKGTNFHAYAVQRIRGAMID